LQRQYQNSDCSLVWKNSKYCSYGCSNNACNLKQTTTTTTLTTNPTNSPPTIAVIAKKIKDRNTGTLFTRLTNIVYNNENIYYEIDVSDTEGYQDIKEPVTIQGPLGSSICNFISTQSSTTKRYKCEYGVTSETGVQSITIKASDTTNQQATFTESWSFNPPKGTISVSTNNGNPITFPSYSAGVTVYSTNHFVISNPNNANVYLYGNDYYAIAFPASCPWSNALDIDYWGQWSTDNVNWYNIPNKNWNAAFPYGASLIGNSNSINVYIRLNIPSPCVGGFNLNDNSKYNFLFR
jgi:hypothetical protein